MYRTDHLNSVRMSSLPPGVNTNKLLRWMLYMDDGSSTIQALAGRANPIADALSRPSGLVEESVKVLSLTPALTLGPEFCMVQQEVRTEVRVLFLPGYESKERDPQVIAQSLQFGGACGPFIGTADGSRRSSAHWLSLVSLLAPLPRPAAQAAQ